MEDPVAAVAENIVDYIRKEDLDGLTRNLCMSDSEWRQELRYEFDLEKMMEAIFRNDILIPKLIMCDIQTISPFHYAALRGVDFILERFVLQHQIPVDMCVKSGTTALHFACYSGMLDTVMLLVERFHADVNRKDRYGWTALHYASTEGNLQVIEYLVQHEADISARDKDGTTAAFRAQAYGHTHIVSYFVKSSGDEDLLLVDDSASDQASLCDEEEIYAVIDVSRKSLSSQMSNGSRTSADASAYEIAMTPTEEGPGKPGASSGKEGVATLVRSQLHDVLGGDVDPYANPVSGRTTGGEGGGCRVPLDIGVNTLTRILTNELLKFKVDHEISKVTDARSDRTAPSSSSSSAQIQDNSFSSAGHYEDISKFERGSVRLQSTPYDTLSPTDDDGIHPPDSNPPPPPPRSSLIVVEKQQAEIQKRKPNKNAKPKKKSLDRVSYMTLKLEDLEKRHPAKTKALIILNRFESSGTVMEACFQELVKNIGDVDNWKRLATALPLRNRPDAVKRCIRNIETRNPADPRKQALHALQDWRYYFGEAANVEALVAAMQKCGLEDKVPLVETAAQEFTA